MSKQNEIVKATAEKWQLGRLTDELAGRIAEDLRIVWNRQGQLQAAMVYQEQWVERHPGGAR